MLLLIWYLKLECLNSNAGSYETLEKPLDCKDIKPINPKGNQSWIFIGRTNAEAEDPIIWPLDALSQFIRKDLDAGKDWRQEKGVTEDEIVGWHHQLSGSGFEQTLGYGEGQEILSCWSPWQRGVHCKELGITERLNNNKKKQVIKPLNDIESLNYVVLNERSQSKKVTYCRIPSMQLSGKCKAMERIQRPVGAVDWRVGECWIGRAQMIFRTEKMLYMILWWGV